MGGVDEMTQSPGTNSPADLARITQKIQTHAETLLGRHVLDLAHAKSTFIAGYDRQAFVASHDAPTAEDRASANLVIGAWDAAMNDLNEVVRNCYGLRHGYQRVGPGMPTVYADAGLALSRANDLVVVNRARNRLTHNYPGVEARRLYDAVELFEQVVVATLTEAKAFALTHGVDIPAVP